MSADLKVLITSGSSHYFVARRFVIMIAPSLVLVSYLRHGSLLISLIGEGLLWHPSFFENEGH